MNGSTPCRRVAINGDRPGIRSWGKNRRFRAAVCNAARPIAEPRHRFLHRLHSQPPATEGLPHPCHPWSWHGECQTSGLFT